MDMPIGEAGHKRHQRATPAVGGLISAIVAGVIFTVSLRYSVAPDASRSPHRYAIFGAVLANMLIGFFDDRKHIPATWRLVFGTGISTLLLVLIPKLQLRQVYFPSIGLSVTTGIFALPFTVICLLALKNAVNMADGRNGLLLGMAIIWNIFFLFHALPVMVFPLLGILACLVVVFVYNWRGKLFMGDCGAYWIATYFGILALYLHKDSFGTVRSAEVVLLFLLPVLDTIRLIVVRLKAGRSPLAADGQHFHHLLDEAIGWTRGWFVYMALMVMPIAAYQVMQGQGAAIILAASILYAVAVWLCTWRIRSKWPAEASAA